MQKNGPSQHSRERLAQGPQVQALPPRPRSHKLIWYILHPRRSPSAPYPHMGIHNGGHTEFPAPAQLFRGYRSFGARDTTELHRMMICATSDPSAQQCVRAAPCLEGNQGRGMRGTMVTGSPGMAATPDMAVPCHDRPRNIAEASPALLYRFWRLPDRGEHKNTPSKGILTPQYV